MQWGQPLIALGSISAKEQTNEVEVSSFEANQFMASHQANYAFAA